MNHRLTAKDRGLIKGAVNRAFARSELHKKVLEAAIVPHSDPDRPRVKKWVRCSCCDKLDAKSYFQVDHIEPKIPLDSALDRMSWDELIDRTWCHESNLQILCLNCHEAKSKGEMQIRRMNKKTLQKAA